MILIADSGSTKCDWLILRDKTIIGLVSTMGFNPYFHSADRIGSELKEQETLVEHASHIKEIHYYGAGCASKKLNKVVENGLRQLFDKAVINVEHDVLGAALAACQDKPGIACILGTGSNSCFFDGSEVHEEIPSLAYILGDEGSGSWYGKQLLRDHLYGDPMPEVLKHDLIKGGFDKNTVRENVYMKPNANVYLASFMPLIAEYRETEYVSDMIHSGMHAFLKRHVCCFENYKEVETNFVGSIAYYFQDILKDEADSLGITVGNIVRKPIDGLTEYHIGQNQPKNNL